MWCSYGGHDIEDRCKELINEYGSYNCYKHCPYCKLDRVSNNSSGDIETTVFIIIITLIFLSMIF